MKHEKLLAIASKYPGKTPAQILLAWALQQGMGGSNKHLSVCRLRGHVQCTCSVDPILLQFSHGTQCMM